jgi:hypothetical protein
MDTPAPAAAVISIAADDGGKKSDTAVTGVGRRITTDATGAATTAA